MLDIIKSKWQRRYLVLDQYMSGKFITLFMMTITIVLAIFILFCVLSYFLSGWTAGEVFIQLTNPSVPKGKQSAVDWWLMVGINLFGLFVVNGILLTLLVNWISNRRDRYLNGTARYEVLRKDEFSVIIGGHPMVARLAKRLIEKCDSRYVLIQTSRSPFDLRMEIFSVINNPEWSNRIIIYSGHRTSWHDIEELNLSNAHEVYIVGESEEIDGIAHDSLNMKCWQIIRQNITEPRNLKLPCHVMFNLQCAFHIFQVTDIDIDSSKTFRFIPFSMYDIWAQQALGIGNYPSCHHYLPIDGTGGIMYDSTDRVHLIIYGMSDIGIALAIQASHIAHYPNFNNARTGSPRTLITFIDPDAVNRMHSFREKFRYLFDIARWRTVKAPADDYPKHETWKIYDTVSEISNRTNHNYPWHFPIEDKHLSSPYYGGYLGDNIVDIDFEFIEGNLSLPSVQTYISEACKDSASNGSESKATVAICAEDTAHGLSTAVYLPEDIYNNALQILLYQKHSDSLASALCKGETGDDFNIFAKLKPFGMTNECDYENRVDNRIARYVAFAYVCLDNGESFGDIFRKSGMREFNRLVDQNWLNMSNDKGKTLMAKRWSNTYSANTFSSKLRSVGLKPSENIIEDQDIIRKLSMTEHNRWVMEQLLQGIAPPKREYAEILPIEDQQLRKYLKSRNMHPDIIANEKLGSTQFYDEEIVKIIPLALWLAKHSD